MDKNDKYDAKYGFAMDICFEVKFIYITNFLGLTLCL